MLEHIQRYLKGLLKYSFRYANCSLGVSLKHQKHNRAMDKLDIFKSIKSNITILQNSKSMPELCFIRDITKSISKNSTIKNGRLGAFSTFNKKDDTFGRDNSKHVSGEDEKQNYKGQDLFGTIYDSTLNSYNKDIPEDFKKETKELVFEEKPIKKRNFGRFH